MPIDASSRQVFSNSVFQQPRAAPSHHSGGRLWWTHLDFTRINIELTTHRKEVEENADLMNVRGVGEKSFLKLKPLVTVTATKGESAGQ